MKILGINGLKRSGKDTTCSIIAGKLSTPDFVVQRAAFADKLKIIAAKALGFDRRDEECITLMDSFKEGASFSILYQEPGYHEALAEAFGALDQSELHELNGRQYLQNLGNFARDTFGDSFWVDQVLPKPKFGVDDDWYKVQKAHAGNRYPGVDLLVITDPRYVNEADRIKALGGDIWEIQRPGLESDGHITEQPLPRELVDYVIVNDGTLDDLSRKVEIGLDTL